MIERKNARTEERSAFAHKRETVEEILVIGEFQRTFDPVLERNPHRVHNFTQNIFRRFRFFLQSGVSGTTNYAVRKHGDGKLLEIVRKTEISPIEECAGLCRALQHQGTARADPQSQLIRSTGAIDDVQGVIMKAGIHFDAGHGLLHSQNIGDVRDGFKRGDWIIGRTASENFALGFVRRVSHLDAHQETIEL